MKFQAQVAAWYALRILAREPVDLLGLPGGIIPTHIRCETHTAVDDVVVDHSGGGVVFIQAKLHVHLSGNPSSRFGLALTQLARQFRQVVTPRARSARPLDTAIDRLVLATGAMSPRTVRVILPVVRRMLAGGAPADPGAGDYNAVQAAMVERFIELLTTAWDGRPSAEDIRSFAQVLRVQELAEPNDLTGPQWVRESQILVDPSSALAAWSGLMDECDGFARERRGGGRDDLARCVGRVARLRLAPDGPRDPDEELRGYLDAVHRTAQQHPWRPWSGLSRSAPPGLGAMYVDQDLVDRTISPANEHDAPRAPSEAPSIVSIEQALDRYRHLVVSGYPGVGKSSLLRHLADAIASAWSEGSAASNLPVFLHARHLASGKPLTQAIRHGAREQLGSKLVRDLPAGLLEPAANLILLIDGFDEINGDQRDRALDALTEVARVSSWRFVVASRPFPGDDLRALRTALGGDLGEVEVGAFDRERTRTFVEMFLERTATPRPLAEHILEHVRRLGFPRWAVTPLALELLRQLAVDSPNGQLPGNRAVLYEKYVGHMPWRPRVSAGEAENAIRRQCLTLLREAAWELCQTDENPSLLDLAEEWIASDGIESPPGMPEEEWRRVLHDVLCGTGLVISGDDDVVFGHQTIMEYLAACHLAASIDPAHLVIPGWGSYDSGTFGWVSEVIVFVGEICASGDRDIDLLAEWVLSNASREDGLVIIGRYVEEGLPLGRKTTAALRAIAGDWREESHHRIEAAEALVAVDLAGSAPVLLAAAVDPDMDQPERIMAMQLLGTAPAPIRAALTWMVSEFGWSDLDLQYRSEAWPLLERSPDSETRTAGLRIVLAAPDMPLEYRIAAGAELSLEGDSRAYGQLKSLTHGWELVGKLVEAVGRGTSLAGLGVLKQLAADPDVDSTTRLDAVDALDDLYPGRG